MSFWKRKKKKKKSVTKKPEIICNQLQLLSNSENSFTEVWESVCACSGETDTYSATNVCFCPQLVSNLCEPYNCPLKATSERTEMDSNSGGYEANLSRAFYFRVAGGDTATLPFFSLLFSCF